MATDIAKISKLPKAALLAVLSDHGVHNPHNFCTAGDGAIYVVWQNNGNTAPAPAGVAVVGLKFKADPEAPWYENNCKKFADYDLDNLVPQKELAALTRGQRRQKLFEIAMQWATDSFKGKLAALSKSEWESTPFSSWVPAGTCARVFDAISNEVGKPFDVLVKEKVVELKKLAPPKKPKL